MLSVIIPAYNESQIIPTTISTLSNILSNENIKYELIFVNDGSTDNSWSIISTACKNNSNVKGVNFSRNFGKESAIFAGLEYSTGDCCAVIDCDLQHPPEKLIEMYNLWLEGYKVIEGIKSSRGDESILYKKLAKVFYSVISKLSGIDMENTSDYKLLDREVVNILKTMPEKHMFFRAISHWVGFKSIQVKYNVRKREIGESKWSLTKLTKYAISNITSFSAAPMQLVTFIGTGFFIFSLVLGIQSFYYNCIGKAKEGFTTVILLLLIVGSVIMISLGIIGYYIAKIYEEIKQRPRYIVSDTINKKDN